jgi:mannose-6-phosphate isomerase-like protein (cupin superfamily)
MEELVDDIVMLIYNHSVVRYGGARSRVKLRPMATPPSHSFDVLHVAQRLSEGNGGYEIVHESAGLQVGVYVLVAPEPDRQQPHEWDEIYVVLEGRGILNVEGEEIPLAEGGAAFVKAGAEHRFVGYEGLSLLVIFDQSQTV